MTRFSILTLVVAILGCGAAKADEPVKVFLTIENHLFTPAEIHVPAGKLVTIEIENKDPVAEEFDSSSLQIEKVIPEGRKANLRLQPLDKGRYDFIGEYHADTAKGVIIAE